MEEDFQRVFGEGTTGVREREIGEEAVRARARKTEMIPSQKELEERNLDHGVFRSWCPPLCERESGVVWACEKGTERTRLADDRRRLHVHAQ